MFEIIKVLGTIIIVVAIIKIFLIKESNGNKAK